jgi:hypothetical protein
MYTRKAHETREAPERGHRMTNRKPVRDRPGADAIRGEGPGDWATYQLRECSETAEGVARESEGVKSCPRAGCGRCACPVVCPVKAGVFSRR